jgi:transcriptional regulator with XRE-family HTH domain
MELDYKKIGINIKKAREAKGISQQDLGGKVNASTAAISLFESGERKPGLEFLTQISKILGVSLKELIEGYDKPLVFVSYRIGEGDDHDKLKEALDQAMKKINDEQ